jgi:anti-anti-sigma factor
MDITARAEGDVKVVSVSGYLDSGSVGEFREKFLEATAEDNQVVLDCSALAYLDSSGLAILVNVFKNLASRESKMVICGFSDGIMRVIEFTKLDRVFKLSDSVEGALAPQVLTRRRFGKTR